MTSNSPRPARREPTPADPDLYPDLAASGSLAAALTLAAAEQGLDLDVVLSGDSDPLRTAGVSSTAPDREACWIFIGSQSRRFIISGWGQGVELLSGSTADLRELARAAAGWRNGAELREIQKAALFIQVSELAQAHERGPAEAVTVRWRLLLDHLREDADGLALAGRTLALVETASAEPKLRQLYPVTSHWSLHFTTCTGFPYSWDVPFVDPLSDGRYRVCGPARGTVIGEADTAEQAVAMVVGALPADCGPAVAGTANDLRDRRIG
ncbi:hypothetical protein GA0115240_132714 [Streptomyces sp. DvalAA-14]|uniref:DUF6193 family natural product biosynthesis protein n=1 Tax=unclassified Streptomyces TaxID=2593676 RepID=UPI00081B096B|nr:DUF6193 family natural product biosynthesis protein [Streptomyces sp. DvalAA-14]MYS21574.1 hypothetical protein [Streptomyces sp. SID4948]SCD95946.1 hypothetical protein GA0115240_132714 [Streptomyces sp. DvalAA-14]